MTKRPTTTQRRRAQPIQHSQEIYLKRGLEFDFGFQYPNESIKEAFIKDSILFERV